MSVQRNEGEFNCVDGLWLAGVMERFIFKTVTHAKQDLSYLDEAEAKNCIPNNARAT